MMEQIEEQTEIGLLKAQIEQLQREKQVLLPAVLEIVQAVEAFTNHVSRVYQALGIKDAKS